eukprot:5835638-Alexandrium_andersonii.AAC.1
MGRSTAGGTCARAREARWSSSARWALGRRTPAKAWTLTRAPPQKTYRTDARLWSRRRPDATRTASTS